MTEAIEFLRHVAVEFDDVIEGAGDTPIDAPCFIAELDGEVAVPQGEERLQQAVLVPYTAIGARGIIAWRGLWAGRLAHHVPLYWLAR